MKSFIAIFLIIVPGLILGIYDKTVAMGLAIVAGALASVFLHLDKFKEFQGAGFSAKLKDEVQKVVEEATATIATLRQAVTPLLYTALFGLFTEDFSFSMDLLVKLKMEKDLENIANDLGIFDSRIIEIVNNFHVMYLGEHQWNFIKALRRDVQSNPFEESSKIFSALDLKDWPWSRNQAQIKEKLLEVVNPYKDKLGYEAKEALEDYLYYFDRHEIRRPEDFRRLTRLPL